MQAAVTAAYTAQSPLAVSPMRGVSLVSFMQPGLSALKSWLPPTPRSGRMATARTMIPMPPIQTMSVRQMLSEGSSASRPVRTVAPEVVMPETASK